MSTKQSLIITTAASAADVTDFPTVTGVTINATEPEGTATRYLFKIGGSWKKYDTLNQQWADAATQELTAASVMEEGNTKAEINALAQAAFAGWAGNTVHVAAAMQTINANQPSITSIQVKGQAEGQQTVETTYSDTVTLADVPVEILDINADTEVSDGGSVQILASILGGTMDENGWSEYKPYTDYVTSPATSAKAIKFKFIKTAPNVGVSMATIKSVSVKHRTDNVAVFSEGVGVCLTKTYNFINPISRAHLMVKHPLVPDTEITAQIALRESPNTVTGEVLGTGTGAVQTAILAHTENLASHNFVLYFDGVQQPASAYSYSPTDGQVTFTATEGVSVTADYIYGWTDEVFVDMTHDTEYPDKDDNNLVDDQFDYVAGENDPKGSVGTVRVTLTQKTGTVTGEALGTGTGVQQGFKLAHHAKAETITVLPAEATWKFKDNTDVLLVTAPQGAAISVSYDWAARTNYLESIACIFNE